MVYPSQGIEFGLTTSDQYKYYISFATVTLIQKTGVLTLVMSSSATTLYDNQNYYEKIASYIETANTTFDGTVVLQFNVTNANNITVIVNHHVLPTTSWSYSNGIITIYNQQISPGATYPVVVYYHIYNSFSVNWLFINLVYGFNVWWLTVFFGIFVGAEIVTYRGYKNYVRKHGIYAAYMAFWFIWIVIFLMHYRGII